jgi:uncharacterized protein YbjT (DUF2867 family)
MAVEAAMTRTIAITTPTGNVGSKLVAHLQAYARTHDLELVLLARKAASVEHLVRSGTRVLCGRLEDPAFLVGATRGVDSLFWVTPNSFPAEITIREGYRRFAESAATAIRTHRIAHTVHLSGFAHVDDGGGDRSLFGALADTEEILGRAVEGILGEHPGETCGITHLRAGFFFENLLGQLNYIREDGRVYMPVNRRRRIPMVASRDVARRAFEILVQDGPRGRDFAGAFGPEDLSFAEAASRMTAGLGRKVRVIRLPRCLVRSRMLKIGRDPRPTDALMLAFDAISRGKVTAEPPRDEASTTPTSLARWAEEVLKPLVDGTEGAVCPARIQYEAS